MNLKKNALENLDPEDDILTLLLDEDLNPKDFLKDPDDAAKVSDAVQTVLEFVDLIMEGLEDLA